MHSELGIFKNGLGHNDNSKLIHVNFHHILGETTVDAMAVDAQPEPASSEIGMEQLMAVSSLG